MSVHRGEVGVGAVKRPRVKEFARSAQWLRDRIDAAGEKAGVRYEYANTMRRELYRYAYELEEQGLIAELKNFLEREYGSAGRHTECHFALTMQLYGADDPDRLSTGVRAKTRKEFWYAWHHEIYWAYVDCFLYFVGGYREISKKWQTRELAEVQPDPWEDWSDGLSWDFLETYKPDD